MAEPPADETMQQLQTTVTELQRTVTELHRDRAEARQEIEASRSQADQARRATEAAERECEAHVAETAHTRVLLTESKLKLEAEETRLHAVVQAPTVPPRCPEP